MKQKGISKLVLLFAIVLLVEGTIVSVRAQQDRLVSEDEIEQLRKAKSEVLDAWLTNYCLTLFNHNHGTVQKKERSKRQSSSRLVNIGNNLRKMWKDVVKGEHAAPLSEDVAQFLVNIADGVDNYCITGFNAVR